MTGRPTLLAAAAAMATMAAAQAEAAGCRLRFASLPEIQFTRQYDPSGQGKPTTRFEVSVSRDGAGCDFAIGVDPGRQPAGTRQMAQGDATLSYLLHTGANRSMPLLDASTGGTGNLLTGRFNGSVETVELDFYGELPDGQIVPAGRYSDTVTFVLYELEGGIPGAVLDTRMVRVEAIAAPFASFEVIVDGARRKLHGTVGRLDFGELETGERMGFELEAIGNLGYDIEIESENGGRFVGQGQAKGSSVPYTVIVDGRMLRLDQRARVPMEPATAHRRPVNQHRIEIEVGDTTSAMAGKYRDDLTLTVTAH
jgi:spore coat protein U-like protein